MISQHWCRLRTGSSVGHLPGRFAHLRCCISPALFGLEPSSGLTFLLLLPCLFLLMFLKGLSRSFRHCCTPAMVFHPPSSPSRVPSVEGSASGPLRTPQYPGIAGALRIPQAGINSYARGTREVPKPGSGCCAGGRRRARGVWPPGHCGQALGDLAPQAGAAVRRVITKGARWRLLTGLGQTPPVSRAGISALR